ncbi:serine--tRNA ligase [Chelatococcus composti]|jgi:seryl-tRNA synthetase|uniref:Serine--tRNA ligase n=1 Tax=Chelatococcus composti TaxID=1743235 RepID=A0A841KBZ5_9HYPH|nr:serine--tRNA ligase [Chelatococcus composti]MBB6166789.1 seryl-tRNA synthetase [Chelatococcus composti]MBS7734285.1 serine--tRNA ligase [Chelatococcus composti]PZN46180.1 MAG: serine--tRNA ligase [Pseudomonadota bacterium]GGG25731.1 serine--tRNA ligase [Chelatococcus composti]
MHDIRFIRENPKAFDEGLARRGLPAQAEALIALDEKRRSVISELQAAQERRNALSREIGEAKKARDEARAQALMAEVAALKEAMQAGEAAERRAIAELEAALAAIPNLPKADVPDGPDETGNVERHRYGEKRSYAFEPKEHFDLGEALGQMDFETAAKLSGARFVVLKGQLARLERAIGQFMLDVHTSEHGYTEVSPPLLVRDNAVYGVGQLPKFEEDLFRTTDDRWLISTAEVPLTNLVRESILSEEELPKRFTALTPCFRSEAGSAGRDTRGMLRQHQFSKVELVSITTPEASADEHERMLAAAEAVLKKLDLHYRVVTLCTGDMGFASQKTYDIEVWLPGQGAYREISSCSVCGDFQARRMRARYRPKDAKEPRFVHTLNGSGTAVGRALIAVMETWQNEDGSITVPPALVSYMGGVTRIERAG